MKKETLTECKFQLPTEVCVYKGDSQMALERFEVQIMLQLFMQKDLLTHICHESNCLFPSLGKQRGRETPD